VDITDDPGQDDGRVLPVLQARAADLLSDARLALRSGQWQQLRALANAVLALDPGNTEAEELLVGSAQRRQMTLMFCDIVGSTALADGRDPEETSDILRAYRGTCAKVIERFGGFIDDHQGDGMLVRFGYPEIHEDDARRAVLSGLEIVAAVRERAERYGTEHATDLHVRVAVHTDLVVLDGVGVAGPTANEAARIQALGQPDTVVISDTTQALVRDWFEVRSMGRTSLRGVSRPVEVFTVLGERPAGCLEPGAGRSPFAGRHPELGRISESWQAACRDWELARLGEARPRVAALFITGAAGVGKTRLVSEAGRTVGARCVHCRCSSYHETTSLHAFRPVLEAACRIGERDVPAQRLAKLRERLAQDGSATDLPFLAVALQIPPGLVTPPPGVDPGMLRDMALRAAAGLVQSHQADGPSILFVDDLHWADQSTVDLVSMLLDAARPGLLLILAARTGYQPPWPESLLERLPLDPLTGRELDEMMLLMPEGSALSEERRSELISRSDGIPLFLEELVRTADAFEREQELHRSIRYADYHIPAALRDPLLARLASPGIALDLVQIAATIGREVDRALLQCVADCGDEEFRGKLDALSAAGLIDVGNTTIHFRHELIREVAYETQRRSVRRLRHSRIADQLARADVTPVQADAGEVAFHLEMAHRYEEAIEVHLQAARSDQSIGAHTEVTRRLTRTLDLLEHLPAGRARQQTELAIRELRSFSAVMAGGYAATEAAQDHPRCVRLCEDMGLAPELLPHLIRSWSYHAFRGDLDEADRVCETMQRVPAGGVPVPVQEMGAGVVGFFRGRFEQARCQMEICARHPWARVEGRPPPGWPLPNDLLTAVGAHLIPTLWISGERRAAFDMAADALERAESLGFPFGPFSVGYVKSLLALTRRLDGDHDAAATVAREMIELSERHGFVLWGMAGTIQYDISEVHSGNTAALDRLVENIRIWRRLLAAEVWTPYWLTELAVAQRMAGRADDALRSLDDAAAVAASTGSMFYLAETLRVRGIVRDERGDPGGRSDVREAYELALRQHAPALASRAATALERMAG
jgi:class 3 adenylate cyclase/tetratricopeptide (TPR) repeat protein